MITRLLTGLQGPSLSIRSQLRPLEISLRDSRLSKKMSMNFKKNTRLRFSSSTLANLEMRSREVPLIVSRS